MGKRNNDAPVEESSTKEVSRFRDVIEVKKPKRRDPRFDSTSGTFDEHMYRQSYGFINEMKGEELKKIKKQMRETPKGTPEHDALFSQFSRLQTALQLERKKANLVNVKREVKRAEISAVKEGKKAFYMSETQLKRLATTRHVDAVRATNGERGVQRMTVKRRQRDHSKIVKGDGPRVRK